MPTISALNRFCHDSEPNPTLPRQRNVEQEEAIRAAYRESVQVDDPTSINISLIGLSHILEEAEVDHDATEIYGQPSFYSNPLDSGDELSDTSDDSVDLLPTVATLNERLGGGLAATGTASSTTPLDAAILSFKHGKAPQISGALDSLISRVRTLLQNKSYENTKTYRGYPDFTYVGQSAMDVIRSLDLADSIAELEAPVAAIKLSLNELVQVGDILSSRCMVGSMDGEVLDKYKGAFQRFSSDRTNLGRAFIFLGKEAPAAAPDFSSTSGEDIQALLQQRLQASRR